MENLDTAKSQKIISLGGEISLKTGFYLSLVWTMAQSFISNKGWIRIFFQRQTWIKSQKHTK